MIRGKIYTDSQFTSGGITENQLIEFDKISKELREIFAKNKHSSKIKENKRKERYGIKNANSIRYGELK